jgi:O-succinylbenzoic acid--CoA ligase
MNKKKINTDDILKKHALNPALIWPGGKLSYLQYFSEIKKISEILSRKGVNPGEIYVVLTDINHHFPIIFFAIINLGGTVLPINPNFPVEKINEILATFESDTLISLKSSLTTKPDNNIRVINDLIDIEMPLDGKDLEISPDLFFDQSATIVLTSGSGGESKGVQHTIGNHYYSAIGSNENIPLLHDDCWMVSLPFYHIAGIAILFRTLLSGAACYIPDQGHTIQSQLEHTRVTHMSLVSTQLYRWLEIREKTESVSSLKAVLLGGSHIPEMLINRAMQNEIPIYTSYGSTEMSSQITTTTIEDIKKLPKTSGKNLSNRELKISQGGEILVRGKTLGEGYVSHKKIITFTDNEGWFHTGDLGYLDADNNLVVTGRKDNMFISGGKNIQPEEIEKQLQEYNDIENVCVVDIPDEEFGARPVAFIKPEKERQINEENLRNYLKERIEDFKIPDRFFPWPEEMDGLKPDRKYLRQLAIDLMR